MKMIIDIPDEAYKQIMEFGFLETTHGKMCYKAIKNSTPVLGDDFLDFLMNVINPNEMEKYISMYQSNGEKVGAE